MDQQNGSTRKSGFFTALYRTRILVSKGETPVLNLSVLFSVISLLCAPWLVIIGAIVALLMGYRFGIDREGHGFTEDFDTMVRGAAGNVKQAVDSFAGSKPETGENDQPSDDSSNQQ